MTNTIGGYDVRLSSSHKKALSIVVGILGTSVATLALEKAVPHFTRYDKEGFDKDGFNKAGFGRDGFNRDGVDCDGFDRDGFGKDGFDRNGYSRDGFDKDGLDRDGYNRSGYNWRGLDRNGRNADGYDRWGYNLEGYDKYGFSKDGFNRDGFDRQGYGRNGYNAEGFDRVGKSQLFYSKRLEALQDAMTKAFEQLERCEFGYALYDSRRVLEETLEQYIMHFCGQNQLGKTIEENINFCERKKLLGTDMAQKLHRVRQICNTDPHEFDAREKLSKEVVRDVVWQVQELLEVVTFDLVCSQQ